MHKVLIVDDNPDILSANERFLAEKGYDIYVAMDGEKALEELSKYQFDCIVLDILLPDVDGFSLCNIIRKKTTAPIIFLSCKADEDDKVKGLMLGGDDYMTKPYSLKELAARIHAQIRRNQLRSEILVLDEENSNIAVGENIINFSKKEFELLMLFYKNPNVIFSSKEIYTLLWDKETVSSNSVAVYVKRLRNKLKDVTTQFGQIKNSYKMGYYFIPPRRNGMQDIKPRASKGDSINKTYNS